MWFDRSTTLVGILDVIERARRDDTIAGIVINTSGMYANIEMKWEIRDKLEEFKRSGK
jgi:hypothetical protein